MTEQAENESLVMKTFLGSAAGAAVALAIVIAWSDDTIKRKILYARNRVIVHRTLREIQRL